MKPAGQNPADNALEIYQVDIINIFIVTIDHTITCR